MTKKKTYERLTMISFRVDQETLRAIELLENSIDESEGIVNKGKRSLAIRRAVLDARDRLKRITSK